MLITPNVNEVDRSECNIIYYVSHPRLD